jgi:hypothetical protein
MILAELRSLLQTKKAMNLWQLTKCLQVEPDVMRDMLQHWIRKGKVQKCPSMPGCGSKCVKCSPMLSEIYQWVEG